MAPGLSVLPIVYVTLGSVLFVEALQAQCCAALDSVYDMLALPCLSFISSVECVLSSL